MFVFPTEETAALLIHSAQPTRHPIRRRVLARESARKLAWAEVNAEPATILNDKLTAGDLIILDGATGTEMARLGAS